jgi:hypothetical protein
MTTAFATADTERPEALSIAQCRCCGSVYSRSEWRGLTSRRLWEEMDLEIAECACGSTISVPLKGADHAEA